MEKLKHSYSAIDYEKSKGDRLLVFNLSELAKYFKFIVNMKENRLDSTTIHRARMRYCTHEDFEHRNVPIDHAFEEIL